LEREHCADIYCALGTKLISLVFSYPFLLLHRHTSQVNIIEVISDALYSDSELAMSSLEELLETLLRNYDQDLSVQQGMAVAGKRIAGSTLNKTWRLQIMKEKRLLQNWFQGLDYKDFDLQQDWQLVSLFFLHESRFLCLLQL
jgi:hypothetical protein